MVASYIEEDDGMDPNLVARAQAERRERLEREIEERAADDERARKLLEILRIAEHLVSASENHNALGDHRLLTASRVRWLHIGALLVERGQLGDASDVFYYRLAEVTALLEGAGPPLAGDEIERRRAEQQRWRAVVPPAHLGAPAEGEPAAEAIRGIAASGGTYRGTARVIASLDQASRLQPGEVLVCSATGPEWTAYFGVAGALVTDMGGLLTHGAVVAREFGIPAVVAAGDATTRILDGATVTVDGSAGTVAIEPSA
jgi:pyruvate,water dikinase